MESYKEPQGLYRASRGVIMRNLYHSVAKKSQNASDFADRVQAMFASFGNNWQRPKRQDLYLFYRMNGY